MLHGRIADNVLSGIQICVVAVIDPNVGRNVFITVQVELARKKKKKKLLVEAKLEILQTNLKACTFPVLV